jgi:glutamate-ammonia-ligase adenylyltransferase
MSAPSALSPLPDSLTRSRYLARLCAARPELMREIESHIDQVLSAALLRAWLQPQPLNDDTLKPALRRLKQRALAHIAVRDLAGLAPLAEVTESMTLIAELAIETALATLTQTLTARYGEPRNAAGEVQALIVIGMGKLGGRELNVSSDIDLIFIYPDDGDTDGNTEGERSISNFDFFTRLGRQLINAIAEYTGDGQVFRVDMRLRPNGDSGPLVCSFEMLENYLITQGREWERYAWIKARPLGARCATDRIDGLEAIRRPFVFRKYLDYGAINAMRDLHAQIRREVARRDMADNVKLGPGGIREIEFIAQVFQLIRGGRDTPLQAKPTLHILGLLAERGILGGDTVRELSSAYDFLRRLEHRLQYLDDAQTHSLPERDDDRAIVAAAMNFSSYEAMLAELDDHRANVSRHFEEVFADPNRGAHVLDGVWQSADGGDAATAEFDRLGYSKAAAAAQRVAALRHGNRYRQMPESSRRCFDAVVPRLLDAAAKMPNADATLARGLDLLEAVARRGAYLALLQQYPQALQKVAQLVSSSLWAAEYLQRHPVLLDELLDGRILETTPDWPAFRARLSETLNEAEGDTERQMDLMREAHHAQVFRLLTQDISGLLTVERLADHLSSLADIMLDLAIATIWRSMTRRHDGAPADLPRFAVISYGKLGGKELGYASDLDIVFLFDDPLPGAAQTYSRLSTRLNNWLSAQTSAGQLFETDLRLRPNGDGGLVVSSMDAFRQYQLEAAWVWEHQALTRARFSAGDPTVGAAFEAIRNEVLRQPRDLAKLRDDVLAMREKMFDALAGKSERFDLKHDRGGIVDVEFIVQYLVLGYAHEYAALTGNLGNIALLRIAAELGLIPPDLAETVRNAYRDYRRMQHALRLNNAQTGGVDIADVAERAAAVRELWRMVFATGRQ